MVIFKSKFKSCNHKTPTDRVLTRCIYESIIYVAFTAALQSCLFFFFLQFLDDEHPDLRHLFEREITNLFYLIQYADIGLIYIRLVHQILPNSCKLILVLRIFRYMQIFGNVFDPESFTIHISVLLLKRQNENKG